MSDVVASCPLCHERDGRGVETIPYASVWRALADQRGVTFDATVVERHTPAEATELRECAGCGLRYFTPSLPGDATFYEVLGSHGYYEASRWEFGVVGARVGPDDDVLDIGCGRGDFVRSVAGRRGRTVGVDHNAEAIARLDESGIEGYAVDLAQLTDIEKESFDVVCAFQILEHVPSVDDLLRPALELLRPGGRLFISVPNRDRRRPPGFEPLDQPPHHISRWADQQFARLAERYGLDLERIAHEQPDFSTAEDHWFETVRLRVGRPLGQRAGLLAARAARRCWITQERYERAAAAERFTSKGVCGHTLLAELVRPAAPERPAEAEFTTGEVA